MHLVISMSYLVVLLAPSALSSASMVMAWAGHTASHSLHAMHLSSPLTRYFSDWFDNNTWLPGVSPESVLSSEPGWQRSLLKWIVDGGGLFEDVSQCDSQTWEVTSYDIIRPALLYLDQSLWWTWSEQHSLSVLPSWGVLAWEGSHEHSLLLEQYNHDDTTLLMIIPELTDLTPVLATELLHTGLSNLTLRTLTWDMTVVWNNL